METAEIIYEGELITVAKHLKSGQTLTTDAPIDNNGKGSNFSPTDLMSVSLASCMLTIIGINAEKNNFDIGKITVKMTKIMGSNPRRVIEIILKMNFEKDFDTATKTKIEEWAKNCPVAKSLNPEIDQNIEFIYNKVA